MLKKIVLAGLALSSVYAQDIETRLAKFRISASGGYAYRLGKKPATSSYFNEISQGGILNADVVYYFSDYHGAGFKYSNFSTAASSGYPSVISNIGINYFGPMYQTRITGATGRFSFLPGVSLGYMSYRDKGWIDHQYGVFKGGSVAALLELGVDLKLFRGLALGLNTSLYGGSLSSVSREGQTVKLDDKQRESLSRVEAGLGLRYSFR